MRRSPAHGSRRRVRWPRRLLLILASRFILVACIPMVALALLLRLYYEPQMRAEAERRQVQAAAATAWQIEQHFNVVTRELGALGQLLFRAPQLSQGELQTLLDTYADASGFYEALYLTDEQGQIGVIALPAERRNLLQGLHGLNIAYRDFVLEAHRRQQGYWSNSFVSPISARLTVALAQPVGNRTLVAELAIARLPALARQLNQHGLLQIRLLDRQNRLVADSNRAQSEPQPSLRDLPVLQLQAGTVSAFVLDNQQLLGVAQKIAGPDWKVLVAQPEAQAYAQILAVWQRVGLVLGLGLVVALLIAGITSWALAKKISQFTQHVGAIAQGSYDLPLPQSSIKELNMLRQSLLQMVSAIREREQAMATTAQNLRDSEDRLLATLENTPNVAVQWFDREGQVLLWNHASETLYGISRENALGKTLDQLIFNPEQAQLFLATLQEAAHGVPLGPYLSELKTPDGRQLYILGTTFSIPAPGGGQHFVCMDIDVTEQKQVELAYRELNGSLEQRVTLRTNALSQSNQELSKALDTLQLAQNELVRSEKLAALGSMVAGIAHELNTPIGNSVMAATTLDDHTKAMATAIETGALRRSMLEQFIGDSQTAADILIRNLRRASELISSFKQVAVDQASAQRRHFQLSEVVNEILITLGPTLRKTPFKIASDIDPGIWLDSYPGALGQILVNLINNALLHGFEGLEHGLINLRAFNTTPGWIELSLTDNGRGIAAEDLPRIFDPFFTTKLGQGGSGLGLNIVHNLATGVLGGRLEVASQPGWGARFSLLLPLLAPGGGQAAANPQASGATSNSPRLPEPADGSS